MEELTLDGGGRLYVRQEGMLVGMEAVRANDGRGLYKVWIRGQTGQLLLGTLTPEGGGLRLRRRLSRTELERSGCWPVTGGEVVLAFSFDRAKPSSWTRTDHPEQLLHDEILARSVRGRTMLLRRNTNGFCLAARFDPGHPFPVTPLFCLSRVDRLDGAYHLLFEFDTQGNPILPHNRTHCGENSGTS